MIPRERFPLTVPGPLGFQLFRDRCTSQELYSEVSVKKTPALSSHYGWSLMRGIYFTFFLKVPDGGIELMLGINKSTFAKGQ